MEKRPQIEIAIAGDSNYIIPLTVLLKSIFINNNDLHITVNFLHLVGAICEDELQQMEAFIVEHGHHMRRIAITEEQLGEVPESRHSKSTFLRLLLPGFLPKEINKILYLDGDTVVNGSLKELYNWDLQNAYIAGAKDPTIIFGKEYCREIGIPNNEHYFNAGVILMNIDRMRKENMQHTFLTHLSQHINQLRTCDQDVLNATMWKDIVHFPPIYNYNYWTEKDIAQQLYSSQELEALKKNPIVIHYIGPVKPWHYKSIHPKKTLWWHYLKQTPYKDYQAQDKTIKNRLSYFFLYIVVRPIKPLLTVSTKQKIGKIFPESIKRTIKKILFKAQ